MNLFVTGQRWINNAELHLGLGTVLTVEQRTITILFQTTGETRSYAKQTAPLTRVIFAVGDKVIDHHGRTLKIDRISETGGLLTYIGRDEHGQTIEWPESLLDHQIRLNRALDRLLSGQIDDNRWFELRGRTLQQLDRLNRSRISGLIGNRTDLIPHQLYIAHEVSRRHAPRVLLADEVGLGKTVEAGLILHEQLLTERIRRVLIMVPDNLLHQWLVEMLRRFNLRFALFDNERYQAMTEFDETANPFEQEQLILCSLDLLTGSDRCLQHALTAGWDMLVVDEAHHLEWSPEQASPGYRVIEQLAAVTGGVLLLTATPEQLGKAGHYARLRLLDPNRFPDYERFVEEEKSYEPVADAIESLFSGDKLSKKAAGLIHKLLGGDAGISLDDPDPQARITLMNRLLDRHGTGRVLFRNTRAAVKGFPERQPTSYPLALPDEYASLDMGNAEDRQQMLSPELFYSSVAPDEPGHWSRFDPRLPWLRELLQKLKYAKVLVICAASSTALVLAEILRFKFGLHATAFHEGLNIIERDRAAAYFADHESGAQVMVCSEIGSEGRNFQFAHHLVLFDLPLNPDLLEQRIGRLDRIGQKQAVQIHIPFIENSPQAFMYQWYQDGLDAFSRPCHAGQAVFDIVRRDLIDALHGKLTDKEQLITTTRDHYRQLNEALEKGRDRLLEYNSCRPEIANGLQRAALEEDQNSTLPTYMEAVFDCFGVHSEEHSESTLILSPAENMLTSFPHLPDEGLTVTFDRKIALAHEDRHFLTWSHPMVTDTMELVLGNEHGNTSVITIKHPNIRAGTMLVECNYLLDSATASSARIRRYLPPTLIRLVLDEKGNDHAAKVSNELIEKCQGLIDRETARKVVSMKQAIIRELIERGNKLAASQAGDTIKRIRSVTDTMLENEITRLRELAQVNPNVREDEIRFFESEQRDVSAMLESALPRLDAMRVIIAT